MLNNIPTKIFIHWPKYIHLNGLIMYCTTIVHKLTPLR